MTPAPDGPQNLDELVAMSADALRAFQSRRLAELIAAVWEANPFQARKLKAAGLASPREVRAVRGLEDLRRLPFTTKAEICADQETHPPYGSNLTHPVGYYTRLHQTSGTTGRPIRWLDTPASWDWLMGLWRLIYQAAEIRPGDRFFFPFSFGPFLGFWAGFEAAVRMGHLTLPAGGMTTPGRLRFMLENGANVVCCTPTYALHMAEVARAEGVELADSPVHTVIVAGEPGGNIPEVKSLIETAWGARCLDHSGMTEIGSLGFEFRARPGFLYMAGSGCIAEILDPATGEAVPPGERGELVLTNLGRIGSPLLRYRTGDLVQAATEPCPFGSSLLAMRGGILARMDDMIQIRGNNVFPSALEAIIRRFPEAAEYRAEVIRRGGLDELILTIECRPDLESNAAGLADRVAAAVKESLNFRPEVRLADPGSLGGFELKAKRFSVHPSAKEI